MLFQFCALIVLLLIEIENDKNLDFYIYLTFAILFFKKKTKNIQNYSKKNELKIGF